MPKMIQIRHVPDRVHRTFKMRAARAGMSLSEYLRAELERSARQLTLQEVAERLAQTDPVTLPQSPAAAVRAERNAR